MKDQRGSMTLSEWPGFWDAAGIVGSALCLMHCLLLPVAIVALPWLVLVEGESLHQALAIMLALPVLGAFVLGWRRHARWLPGALMAGGLMALNVAVFAAPKTWETGLTVLGGIVLIAAHALNALSCRRCTRCAADASGDRVWK